MKVEHLISLLEETRLSPEQLSKYMGVSNMTIRRVIKKSKTQFLPSIYKKALEQAVFQLIVEDKLPVHSCLVEKVLAESESVYYSATLKYLGCKSHLQTEESIAKTCDSSVHSSEDMMLGLTEIGSSIERQEIVQKNSEKLNGFKKLSELWTSKIEVLQKVLSEQNFTLAEKLIAFGALFYLITPFDLIPDQTPFFGLVDDFGVLEFASAFYLKKML